MSVHNVTADQFLDILDKHPRIIALIYTDDSLGAEALSNFIQLPNALMRVVTLYAVQIQESKDAETLQIIKLPQYRIFRNGSEEGAFIGNLPLDELSKKVTGLLG